MQFELSRQNKNVDKHTFIQDPTRGKMQPSKLEDIHVQ